MITHPAFIIALGVAWSTVGCAPGSDGETDRGDIEIPITEEIRIGRLEGPEEYIFGRLGAIAPAPDRSVYVAEAQLAEIRHLDGEGTCIGSFGRKGEGPGEFASIDGLAVLSDGRIVAWDADLRRLSVFNRTVSMRALPRYRRASAAGERSCGPGRAIS